MGEYLAPISLARNRLLVSDGSHPFDVWGMYVGRLKVHGIIDNPQLPCFQDWEYEFATEGADDGSDHDCGYESVAEFDQEQIAGETDQQR